MIQHALASEDGPILLILQSDLSLNEVHAHWLCNFGAIYHNHQRIRSSDMTIKKGDYLRVHSIPRRFPVEHSNWKSCVLAETNDFVVINKPFGIPTHATVDNLFENAAHQISLALNTPIYVTHRLDVATSGILLLAKTKELQRQFNFALQDGLVEKTYVATVSGHLTKTGLIEHFMETSNYLPKQISSTAVEGWRPCLLEILQTQAQDENSQVIIRLITGRTHQIRAQMSALGHPVLGDRLYTGDVSLRKLPWGQIEKIELKARSLKFKLNRSAEAPEYFYSIEN